MPTDRRFTGQRHEAGLGLYDYGARYYDPTLGRFVQADTIVPEPGNPQSLNRYSYVLNSPLRYTDPSGHYTNDETQKYLQETYGADWQSYWEAWQADPYWMWILDQAQDNYLLEIAATGITIQFRDKAGSFALSEGKLHEFQGQGAYALRNEKAELVEDSTWLGYLSEAGTFGAVFRGGTSPTGFAGGYFQPIYDYSSGKPSFINWCYIEVSYTTKLHIDAGTGRPWLLTGAWSMFKGTLSKIPAIAAVSPEISAAVLFYSVLGFIDNLTVNTADQVSYRYVDWTPPVTDPFSPVSSRMAGRQNPNGIGYPAPLGH